MGTSPPESRRWNSRWVRAGACAHAGYFALTGLWPLLHYPSFIAITGPKVDDWLVLTVAGLVLSTGLALGLAAWRHRLGPEWAVLAVGQAVTLVLVDVVSVAAGRISRIYLLDAVAECLLIVAWLVVAFRPLRSS